jgi:hypothetical protein
VAAKGPVGSKVAVVGGDDSVAVAVAILGKLVAVDGEVCISAGCSGLPKVKTERLRFG